MNDLMKKILTAAFALALPGTVAVAALAAGLGPSRTAAPASEEAMPAPGFAIEIDGEDAGARACVLVPLRAVAEKLGLTVARNEDAITVAGPERYTKLTIGVDQYFAAPTQEGMMGASLFSLGCAPVLMGDAVYVPVELFDALLGCGEGTVALDGDTVRIHTGPAALPAGGGSAMGAAQAPNPFTDRATLAEAAQAAGFPMSAPDTLEGYPQRMIQTMNDEMIQVIYQNGDSAVTVRKEAGSGDISGDYRQFAWAETVTVDGAAVAMRGGDGLVMTATWEDDGYTYAVTSDAGMSTATMTALIQSVG